MITKVTIKCPDCARIHDGDYDTVDHDLTSTCPVCGKHVDWIVDLRFHIGHAFIAHSSKVLAEGDTNFSILLSAMAIDCYLSRLYLKRRRIEELLSNRPYEPNVVTEMIQEELGRSGDFLAKVKKVESYHHPQGTADFIHAHAVLEKEIQAKFPEIQIDKFAENIRNEVMWKRNSIIHSDLQKYTVEQAKKAIDYAQLFIKVFQMMDEIKSAEVP